MLAVSDEIIAIRNYKTFLENNGLEEILAIFGMNLCDARES